MIDDINAWRKSNLGSLTAHDVVHLFSGLDFEGSTIENWQSVHRLADQSICDQSKYCTQSTPSGQAPLQDGYCYFGSPNYCCFTGISAAISQVHRETSQRDSVTMVHEIGHQLGMSHDHSDQDGCPETGKIMAAAATHELEVDWSSCSISEYNARAGTIYQECLSETTSSAAAMASSSPESSAIVRTTIVHVMIIAVTDGRVSSRRTRRAPPLDGCCDETTCSIALGTVCRASLGPCDTAETCDGVSKSCPVDTVTQYGTACVDENGDAGACWANACRNRDYKCQKIGPYHGGKKASGTCPRTPRTMNPEHRPRVCPRMHSRGRAFQETIRAPHSMQLCHQCSSRLSVRCPRREAFTETYAMVWVPV